MAPDDLDTLFAALAHPQRRLILDLLRAKPGMTTADLTPHLGLSGVGTLKHVQVLERANLIVSRTQGRQRHLFFNIMPIQLVYDRWTDEYAQFWAGRVADLKELLESKAEAGASSRSAARQTTSRQATSRQTTTRQTRKQKHA